MSEPSLPQKIVAIDAALEQAKIAHAFGGALALAYYAEPRATNDVDVNVFTSPGAHADVVAALGPLGVEVREHSAEEVDRDGQVRWWWGRNPVDLFFAYDALHDAMRDATRRVPFGEQRIPILAPEHLATCKVIFNRPKDWIDLEQMLAATDIDVAEVERWIDRVLGADDPRMKRFEELAARGAS